MKAALYFEGNTGFGDWRILISGPAESYLREAKKKSPSIFQITVRKIK